MTEARFCPNCGLAFVIAGQRFCAGCGAALPVARSTVAATDAGHTESEVRLPSASVDAVRVTAAPLRQESPPQALIDWATLRAAAVAVIAPLGTWLVLSLVAAVLFANVFASAAGSWVGSLPVVSAGLGTIDAATYGLLASLFAGLGYHLGADLSASGLGLSASAAANLDVSAKAVGSMMLIGLATVVSTRSAFARVSTAARAVVLMLATLIAAAAAISIYIVASVLGFLLGGTFHGSPSLGIGPFSISGSVAGSLQGGPRVGDVLPVTFVLLLIAALAGAAWAIGRRRLVGEWITRRLAPAGTLVAAGLGGPLFAVVVLTVPFVICAIVWWISSGPADPATGVRLLPLLIAYTPNWIGAMMVLATGTIIQSSTGGAVGGPIVFSIWHMPPWLMVLGFGALLLPGYLAGVVVRGRDPRASPARVAVVAIPVVLSMLFLAALALPSAQVTQSGISQALAQDVRFSIDWFQAIVVTGVVSVGTVLTGFQFGAPVWRVLSRLFPVVKPAAPPPMHFR